MSIVERTRAYATEVAETALNGFDRQARGTLPAPNGDENVRLFTARGGSAVTLAAGTRSAAVVYDPEATLRNGQLAVYIYERSATDAVTAVQRVALGRSSDEFISAGILSSGLKVFNSSGVDVIGGTQTAGVLTSVPRDISTLTTTDVANFSPNHERDLVSGVVSREDATMTLALTEHLGKKMCLARANTTSNLVKRTWDDGIGTRRTTSGESLGPSAVTAFASIGTGVRTAQQVLDAPQFHLLDSNNLSASNNPLTLATFNVDFSVHVEFDDSNAADTSYRMDLKALAIDASGTIITSIDMTDVTNVTADQSFMCIARGSLTSSTVPIARVVVGVDRTQQSFTTLDYKPAFSTNSISAYEETADVAARPIHVCVFEGLNASATINVSSYAVLTGVPDSSNVFIASAQEDDNDVTDFNSVEIFMKSVIRSLPRAFTVSGHGEVTRNLTAMYNSEEVDVAFKAMSFGDVTRGVRKLGSLAKGTAKDLPHLLSELKPYVELAGTGMSMMPGTAGRVGAMVQAGARRF
uniref:Uncharacterized protein n=1 Tax=viral metagenome TaxID=1070528 RepID=A0A2V0RC97_9ZZZZ